ncbi:MAG: hypothetical protein LQ340_004657 [Diploschistes diacapsis]|nr:MAG: hypothetical protein LQ340_004657 [Diploschistes diacapsis]
MKYTTLGAFFFSFSSLSTASPVFQNKGQTQYARKSGEDASGVDHYPVHISLATPDQVPHTTFGFPLGDSQPVAVRDDHVQHPFSGLELLRRENVARMLAGRGFDEAAIIKRAAAQEALKLVARAKAKASSPVAPKAIAARAKKGDKKAAANTGSPSNKSIGSRSTTQQDEPKETKQQKAQAKEEEKAEKSKEKQEQKQEKAQKKEEKKEEKAEAKAEKKEKKEKKQVADNLNSERKNQDKSMKKAEDNLKKITSGDEKKVAKQKKMELKAVDKQDKKIAKDQAELKNDNKGSKSYNKAEKGLQKAQQGLAKDKANSQNAMNKIQAGKEKALEKNQKDLDKGMKKAHDGQFNKEGVLKVFENIGMAITDIIPGMEEIGIAAEAVKVGEVIANGVKAGAKVAAKKGVKKGAKTAKKQYDNSQSNNQQQQATPPPPPNYKQETQQQTQAATNHQNQDEQAYGQMALAANGGQPIPTGKPRKRSAEAGTEADEDLGFELEGRGWELEEGDWKLVERDVMKVLERRWWGNFVPAMVGSW